MKKPKRIPRKYLPTQLPLFPTILIAFLMDYYKVDNLWWGVFYTVGGIIWIAAITMLIHEEHDENLLNKNVVININKLVDKVKIKKDEQ